MTDKTESDVLYGLEAIAKFFGMTANQAKHRVAVGGVPTFKMPGSRVVCARRSTLSAWIAAQEAKSAKVVL